MESELKTQLEKDVHVMQKDISDIKTALIGNEYNNEQSINFRLKTVESRQKETEKRELRFMGFLFGVSFIVTLLWNVFTELLKP